MFYSERRGKTCGRYTARGFTGLFCGGKEAERAGEKERKEGERKARSAGPPDRVDFELSDVTDSSFLFQNHLLYIEHVFDIMGLQRREPVSRLKATCRQIADRLSTDRRQTDCRQTACRLSADEGGG